MTTNLKYGDKREDGYVFVGWKKRGEKMRAKGAKGAPTAKAIKASQA